MDEKQLSGEHRPSTGLGGESSVTRQFTAVPPPWRGLEAEPPEGPLCYLPNCPLAEKT